MINKLSALWRHVWKVGAALAGFVALYYRWRSKANRRKAAKAEDRAQRAEASRERHEREARERRELSQHHREEIRESRDKLKRGDRDHLDSDW